MKEIGIWMDKEKAHIVHLKDEQETLETLYSKVEFFNPKGGSRSKAKWGPQDVVQDSRYLEREKNQLRVYFQDLTSKVKGADAIALFGPSDTIEKFHKQLMGNHKPLAAKVKTITKVDSMTDNQVKALVRDFFKTAT